MDFKKLEAVDKEVLQRLLLESDNQRSEYSCVNLCGWQFLYPTEICIEEEMVYTRVQDIKNQEEVFLFPLGCGDRKAAVEKLRADAHGRGLKLKLKSVLPEEVDLLHACFPGQMRVEESVYLDDYLYHREDLAELRGRKYQGKRNLIHQFENSCSFEFRTLDETMVEDCIAFAKFWATEEKYENSQNAYISVDEELRCIEEVLGKQKEIPLLGIGLYIDGKMQGFSYGSPINRQTFDVNIEKANVNFKGIYPALSRELARRIPENYLFVNREEDMGIEGLRKAKESYYPCHILKKYSVIEI